MSNSAFLKPRHQIQLVLQHVGVLGVFLIAGAQYGLCVLGSALCHVSWKTLERIKSRKTVFLSKTIYLDATEWGWAV